MTTRKCIYTGKEAEAKDSVIPKKDSGEELHNWANKAPICKDYKDLKQDRLPTEEEMELNRLFYKLELSKLDVKYYEIKISKLQKNIRIELDNIIDKKEEIKKEKEIKVSIIEKEIVEESNNTIEKILENRKKDLWE